MRAFADENSPGLPLSPSFYLSVWQPWQTCITADWVTSNTCLHCLIYLIHSLVSSPTTPALFIRLPPSTRSPSPSFSIFFWYKISGSASFIHWWLSLLSCCSSSGSCCKRLSYLKMVLLVIITSECKCVNAGALRSTKPRADTAFSVRTAMKEVLQGKPT